MCPISIFIRLGLVHVVVVEWLSLKENEEQGNQLTAEGKPRLLFSTRNIATK